MTNKKTYYAVKRGFDFIVSAVGLTALSPLILATCLLIKIDNPKGGAFFIQERCGQNNALFRMYKFRTMHVDADKMVEDLLHMNEADGPVFKIKDDPRITKVGRFLRKTHIDEIPQLLNVLKGDMSLVGPRPPLPREVEEYEDWHHHKLDVKQGMTCYWQISPNRNDIPFDDWIALDLKYIETQSVKTDVLILIKTIGVVFRMNGV